MQTMSVSEARAAVARGAVISASIHEAPTGDGWTLSLSGGDHHDRVFVETTRSRSLKIYRRIDATMTDVSALGLKTASVVLGK